MTPPPPAPFSRESLRAQVAPVLAVRVRAGVVAAAFAVVLYAVADWVANHEQLLVLWCIALGQLAVLGGALVSLRGTPSWRRVIVTTVLAFAVLMWSGLASDVFSGNLIAAPLSAVGAAVGASAVLPWGAGPQALASGIAFVTGAGSLLLVHERLADVAHPAALGAILLGGSVVVAGAAERVRRERATSEAALQAFTRRAESEARIASVLARASEVLASHLDEPDMLDRLHGLAREALEVDWSATFIVDRRGGGVRLAAQSPAHAVPEAAAARACDGWTPAAGPEGVFETSEPAYALPAALRDLLGGASCLGAPLCCRGTVLGLQVHARRAGAPFTSQERRLAGGLAHASALALENAERIARLESASRLKTEFVATMSHELRTPLNVITGYTEMLGDDALGPLTSMQRDTVHRIRRSADELLELVNATLDVGRLEAGRMAVEREAVDLGTLLAELDGEVRPLLSSGVALGWHQRGGVRAVLTDRGKLKTVLKNLVGNACKFTPRGRIDVGVVWQGGALELVVRDTGVGIPAAQLPYIFEMFRQGDGSTTRRFSGVGLGLHIVHRLVELLGGAVAVDSTPGAGSTFTVRLPAPLAVAAPAFARRA